MLIRINAPLPTELRELYVENNRLPTVRRCALHSKGGSRERLRTLSLYGNPIQCDCRLTAWVQEMRDADERTVVWGTCAAGGNSAVGNSGLNESMTSSASSGARGYDGGDVISQSLFRTMAGCNGTVNYECHLRS